MLWFLFSALMYVVYVHCTQPGGVEALAVLPGMNSIANGHRVLASSGSTDRSVALWDARTWQELHRVRVFPKASVTSMAHIMLPQLGGPGFDLLVASYAATPSTLGLMCRIPKSAQPHVKAIVDMSIVAHKTSKKRVKVYAVHVYPADSEVWRHFV